MERILRSEEATNSRGDGAYPYSKPAYVYVDPVVFYMLSMSKQARALY